jgi:hypothetical protein
VLTQVRESIGERAWAALYMGEPPDERRAPTATPAVALAKP